MEDGMERAVRQMKRAVADAEGLLEASGNPPADARGAFAARVEQARERLVDLERDAARRAREAAHEAARYAQAHPWQVTGISVGAAIAIGIAVGAALRSRKH